MCLNRWRTSSQNGHETNQKHEEFVPVAHRPLRNGWWVNQVGKPGATMRNIGSPLFRPLATQQRLLDRTPDTLTERSILPELSQLRGQARWILSEDVPGAFVGHARIARPTERPCRLDGTDQTGGEGGAPRTKHGGLLQQGDSWKILEGTLG